MESYYVARTVFCDEKINLNTEPFGTPYSTKIDGTMLGCVVDVNPDN